MACLTYMRPDQTILMKFILPRRSATRIFCSLWLTVSVASAQEPAAQDSVPSAIMTAEGPEPAQYGATIDQALKEHERGNFVEARELLRVAHKAFPNARTLRGLGKVEFELRNYGDSVAYLRQALESQVRP